MLACPGCKRLTHTRRLESLASQANAAATAGDVTTSLQFWREALELLPRDSKQFAVISNRISELGLQLPKSAAPTATSTSNLPGGAGVATGLGAIGLLIWKFKVLLIGLTKTTTLFSMLASLGVYWAVWGWKFALGLVLSIYIHEKRRYL